MESVALLLDKGADVSCQANNGTTPLHLVGDNVPVAEMLVKKGANMEKKTLAGYTPLASAAYLGNKNVAEFLVKSKAQLNATTQRGYSSMHLAAIQGNDEMVSLLLEAGANSNLLDNAGKTPLQLLEANSNRNSEVSQVLTILSQLQEKQDNYTPIGRPS